MRFSIDRLASIFLLAFTTPLMAQDMTPDHTDTAQQAMIDMQYADNEGCFIISGDAVRPVLPLLVASDGLDGVSHQAVLVALDAALARGCDIDQPDINGLSPLNTAIVQGNTELISYLLAHGANPNKTITNEHWNEPTTFDNSLALVALLAEKNPDQQALWQEITELLQRKD